MNGKTHSQLIKIFLNWYTFYQFWFKLRKEVVIKMAEAQFDLCFSSDWESDGSYKDPPYLPEKDDVSSSSDSDSEEIQFKEKGVSVKRKAEKENTRESYKKVQRVQLDNLNESTSEYP